MEAFHTLQGEGAYAGQAAYFVRLGGCDVGCIWCDVKESWPLEGHPMKEVKDILSEALMYPTRIVVVTGGEPLMYDLSSLTRAFRDAGFRTHLETSGTRALTGSWHHICFSPKKFKDPVEGFHSVADELKVIVYNAHDLKWAEGHADRVSDTCGLYLQPEWDRKEAMTPGIVDHVLKNPKWRISLQTHKYLNIP